MASPQLKLLVDLDQTLIDAFGASKLQNLPPLSDDLFRVPCPKEERIVKVRPHTREFLQSVAKHYEMTVVTLAGREAAEFVVKKLDPERKLFGDRIVSRAELGDHKTKTKNLETLFPEGFKQTAIIDDRVDVWGYHSNVIRVLPFHFFGLECEDDDTLKHMERVLIEVHRRFHEHYERTQELLDLKVVIRDYRKEALQGIHVELRGFHTAEKVRLRDSLLLFGAQVHDRVNAETTVVVASNVEEAEENCRVVLEHWVEEVKRTWQNPGYECQRYQKLVRGVVNTRRKTTKIVHVVKQTKAKRQTSSQKNRGYSEIVFGS